MSLKRQMFSRTYLVYSIIRDQYTTKLSNLDLICDEGALVFDGGVYLKGPKQLFDISIFVLSL